MVPSAVCSGPTAHGQTAKNTPTATYRRERGGNNAEKLKLATTRVRRRKRLSLKPEISLQNCLTILHTEEERLVTSGETLELSKAAQYAPHTTTSTNKKR